MALNVCHRLNFQNRIYLLSKALLSLLVHFLHVRQFLDIRTRFKKNTYNPTLREVVVLTKQKKSKRQRESSAFRFTSLPHRNVCLLLICARTPIMSASLHSAYRSAVDVVLRCCAILMVKMGFMTYKEVTLGLGQH